MNGMKKKLLATTSMLMASAMMLTTASYAWFTISTAPEITGMTTTVVTNENLEIALASSDTIPGASTTSDSHNYYTYGNLIDLTDTSATDSSGTTTGTTSTAAYTDLDKTLRPMTISDVDTSNSDTVTASSVGTDGILQYPTYGTDGRISALANAKVDAQSNGFGTITNLVEIEDAAEVKDSYGYYIDYWMRSNIDGTVTLSASQIRTGDTEDDGSTFDITGDGSIYTIKVYDATANTTTEIMPLAYTQAQKEAVADLAASIRIAFVTLGDTTGTDGAFVYASGTGITSVSKATTGDAVNATPVTTGMTTTTDTSGRTVVTFTGVASTLTANVDTLVRMYVYIDGATVTNASASQDDYTIAGDLNVQFEITDENSVGNGINSSMDQAQTDGVVDTSTTTTP